ncbi:MAG: alpha/beta hydrolase [Mobilicoccus sp.]|nr:alpha/beta hydrolase [Mobilicoccus sp.]
MRLSSMTSPLRVVHGLIWTLMPVMIAVGWFSTLRHGHPALPILLLCVAATGVVLMVTGARRVRRWRRRRSRARLLAGVVAGTLATTLMAVTVAFLTPHRAEPVAIEAMAGTPDVTVTEDWRSITFTPQEQTGVGFVFQPGARVEARAAGPLMTQLAELGHTVVVVKQPFTLGFAALGAEQRIIETHPEVERWAVGGHSLGGVAAARAAASGDPRIVGLVMWAAYPDSATTVRDVPIAVLYGTRDGLIPPADITGRVAGLHDATLVPIEGANHAAFSDYGQQRDDLDPTVSREVAHARIVAATEEFLASLAS